MNDNFENTNNPVPPVEPVVENNPTPPVQPMVENNPMPPVQPVVENNPTPPVNNYNQAPQMDNMNQQYNQAPPANNMNQQYNQVPPANNMNQQYNQVPPTVNVNNYNQVPNNTLKPVNKLVYCLLAFFVGGIGIHKFYAGKIAAGILYILFCWTFIPGIIAFVEFIIGITKQADANGNIYL